MKSTIGPMIISVMLLLAHLYISRSHCMIEPPGSISLGVIYLPNDTFRGEEIIELFSFINISRKNLKRELNPVSLAL